MTKRIGRNLGHRPRLEALEGRALMAAPVIDALPAVNVPASKALVVPVTATDADGDPLSFSVSSDGSAVAARVVNSGVDLKLSVAGYGDMVFELMPNFAPNTVSKIVGLVNSGFYNGLIFHRVVPGFVIQGGDPNGTGSGGPGFQFDDEFNPEAIFDGDGQLAMANSGNDTDGSQFFATVGHQRFLDFNYTIFGQLLRGFDILKAINAVPTDAGSKPITPVVITSATIVNDTSVTALILDAGANGSATITVTASDGHGNNTSTTFKATAVADSTDDPPFLGPIGNQITATNTTISIPLTGTDIENNPMTFAAGILDSTANATYSVSGNLLTVIPKAGYKGDIHLIVGVKQTGATSRGSSSSLFDTQKITLTVKDQAITPMAAATFNGARADVTSGKVASFTAAVPWAASKFTATIDWGDGSATSAGTITQQPDGSYAVSGTHTYTSAQTFAISTSIKDTSTQATASIGGTATIVDVTPTFLGLTPSPGTGSFAGTLASFKDPSLTSVVGDFTATIDWGDGTSGTGSVTKANDGSYLVSGTKTYANLGQFAVDVTLLRHGISVAKASGTLAVANRVPTLDAIGSQSVAEGGTVSVQALGHDPDGGQTLTYSLAAGAPSGATINPSTGLFTWAIPQGTASGSITVIATDSGTPAMTASRTFPVYVQIVTPTFLGLTPGPGTGSVAGNIASFKDADPTSVAADFTASIDWGDGTTTVGGVAKASDGSYGVTGSHTYASLGQFAVNATLLRHGVVASKAAGTLTVANRTPTLDAIATQTVPEGSTFAFQAVGHDPDAGQTLTYTLVTAPAGATINPMTGIITWTPAQGPAAVGFAVAVTDSGNPAMAAATSFAVNVNAVTPVVTIVPAPGIPLRQYDNFSAVGSFSDPGLGPWTATVDYGDGSGRVNLPLTADRRFTLNHVYTTAGSFAVNVQVTDPSGLVGSATVTPSIATLPPVQITSAVYHKTKKVITGIDVAVNGVIDTTSLGQITHFMVVTPGKDKKYGTKDDKFTFFKTSSYDATRGTIALTFAKKFAPSGAMQFQVNGLRDSHGRAIAKFAATIGKAQLTAFSIAKR